MQLTFDKIPIADGFNLYLCPTDRFKSVIVKMLVHLPLDKEATANALISRLLPKGCTKYPNQRKIVQYLESLYGASFSAGVVKIGERHILEFRFSTIAERFLPKRFNALRQGLEFLNCVLAEPLRRNNGFDNEYFSLEKNNLGHVIESLIDNKIYYAYFRCIQEMCRDEPYRIYEGGRIDDLPRLNSRDLLSYWFDILSKSPIDIYILGCIKPENLARTTADVFTFRRAKNIVEPPSCLVDKDVVEPRLVKEEHSVEQGKLVLGYRTGTSWQSGDIVPLVVANGILGSFSHSKLFVEVREKAGLAYYASSSMDKTKGLMFVRAGISHDKFDQALAIINEQIERIKQGDISKTEFSNTIKSMKDRLNTMQDSPGEIIDFTLQQSVNRCQRSIETILEQIESVTPNDVSQAAQKIKLDTIYFMTSPSR